MSLEEVVLINAVKAFTEHTRKHAHRRAFADKKYPTGAEVEAHRVAVYEICEQIEALAQSPESSFAEIESLRDKMGRHFPPHNLDYMGKIADAYEAAGRATPARAKRVRAKAA